jgi:hypothetical protein
MREKDHAVRLTIQHFFASSLVWIAPDHPFETQMAKLCGGWRVLVD